MQLMHNSIEENFFSGVLNITAVSPTSLGFCIPYMTYMQYILRTRTTEKEISPNCFQSPLCGIGSVI